MVYILGTYALYGVLLKKMKFGADLLKKKILERRNSTRHIFVLHERGPQTCECGALGDYIGQMCPSGARMCKWNELTSTNTNTVNPLWTRSVSVISAWTVLKFLELRDFNPKFIKHALSTLEKTSLDKLMVVYHNFEGRTHLRI